ncbi:kinetochore protein NDC80 homolog [Nematostella vectensis]|uniref:kinetochore protein NDC80 homolog n=1 Tax=Nematostella vectensis TaxID=45351 RepID=UPI00207760DE|nr:kinetochore protein NDC80 homolog [Nematostella vectensis]
MRRQTLGMLNIGNQPRQPQEKKKSLGSRRQSTGGRLSLSGRPSGIRRSSQYGAGSSQVVKDPRPLSDKGYQQKMIRTLTEFLTEFNYPHPISNRILSAPPMKEFKRIFLFIYKYVNDSSKVQTAIEKKPEEEIPKILKMLGYPFNISKSSMFSVGSPHTWPNLLGALCYLIELIRYCIELSDSDNILFLEDACEGADAGDGPSYFDKCYFEYLEKSYSAFLMGKELDELEEYDHDFYQQIRSKYNAKYQELDELKTENAELENELAKLEGMSMLQDCIQQKKGLAADEEKFRKYIGDLKRHSTKMEESDAQTEEEIQAIRLELEEITRENTQLQTQLNQQELSPADVENMKKEKQECKKMVQTLEQKRDGIDQQIWEQEMKFAKTHEETHKLVSEYNVTARKLKLIPASAPNALGLDLEMRFNPMDMQPDFGKHFKAKIKNPLISLKQKIAESTREIQSHKITEVESLDQITDMVESKKEEAEALEAKLAGLDKELEWRRDVMNKEYTRLASELQAQEDKVLNMKQQVQAGTEKKEQELREVQERAESRLQEMANMHKEYDDFLGRAGMLVMDHKTIMQNRVSEIQQLAKDQLNQAKRPNS